jgi:tRNA(fMet)-specific endonuclease VapC
MPLEIVQFDAHAAKKYGDIRAGLERSGQIIGGNDLFIAAHALSLEATLITNNVKEFERVPELHIENWAKQRV